VARLEPIATLKFSRMVRSSLPECPECKKLFETWIDVAGHMVRNDTDHHDHIEGITGKGEGSFYRSREVKELAKILKDRYGKPTKP
jgi:hypothetical protein